MTILNRNDKEKPEQAIVIVDKIDCFSLLMSCFICRKQAIQTALETFNHRNTPCTKHPILLQFFLW